MRRSLRTLGVCLLVVVAGGVAAACSTQSASPPVASLTGNGGQTDHSSRPLTPAQSDRDMVKFARCLRAHGVNEPDPMHIPGHTGLSVEVPAPGPSTRAALSSCNHFLAPIAAMKRAAATARAAPELRALTNYAACMRRHDIAMLNPTPAGELNLGRVPGITSNFGRYSPQFRAADHACRRLLPHGVRDNGSGP